MRAILIYWTIFVADLAWALPPNLAQIRNKTITELLDKQAEAVKKIVADQSNGHFTKKHEQKEQPVEDLKSKCEHYFKLNNLNSREVSATTQKPITTTKPNNSNKNHMKVIKLEPVTLEKTTLNNGEVVYYWYKNVQGNLIQNGAQFYQQQTTTTTTQPPPIPLEQPYNPQMKFVVPMALPEEKTVQNPPPIDHYAYYPKEVQPAAINMPVPYVPVFHMIHAITLPNQNK